MNDQRKSEPTITSVYVKNIDPEVRARADEAAKKLGFRGLTSWVLNQVHQLAGDEPKRKG